MNSVILAVLIAFIISIIAGYFIIPFLRRLKFGQNVRDDGPKSHLKKAGTPTMGGIIIVIALIISSFLFAVGNYDFIFVAVLITLAYGIIGFIDDFIKIVMKRSLGLKAYQKMIGQIGVAIIFAFYCYKNIGSEIIVPFTGLEWDLGAFYVPIAVFIIVGTVNSVNLTDGLDGLASGVTVVVAASFSIIAAAVSGVLYDKGLAYLAVNYENIMIFAGALTGACLGFLRYNIYPAKVFMGDTGSLAIGGAISALALLLRLPLLLPLVGFVYMLESISVMIQVAYFKKTGKRIFKMSPLHHHFELKGMHETQVVGMFVITTAIACLIGILAV